ncbi:hypothetical protein EV356DRAFT_501452 [Viridothelium virens]|uniref:Uncharacterized protein n=1 Tax=Viridothelium virens TaxID=1048519 RepID=A0A6A6H9P1_VIRVR|nr:hypothetical protein EV356DRAFT_501452 [Viridothelium virens]
MIGLNNLKTRSHDVKLKHRYCPETEPQANQPHVPSFYTPIPSPVHSASPFPPSLTSCQFSTHHSTDISLQTAPIKPQIPNFI